MCIRDTDTTIPHLTPNPPDTVCGKCRSCSTVHIMTAIRISIYCHNPLRYTGFNCFLTHPVAMTGWINMRPYVTGRSDRTIPISFQRRQYETKVLVWYLMTTTDAEFSTINPIQILSCVLDEHNKKTCFTVLHPADCKQACIVY